MRRMAAIAYTGVVAVAVHRLRSVVTVACLLAVMLPYLVGIGISQGIQIHAQASLDAGADLYVSAQQFGRRVAVPLQVVEAISRIDGVTAVTPRIVGSILLGKQNVQAVLVGLPPERFSATVNIVTGRLPSAGGKDELVIGTHLASQLQLDVGAMIPPFYYSSQGQRVSRIVGVFRSEVALWQSHLALTTFETAARIFDQKGLATELLVTCRPGYQERVQQYIVRNIEVPEVVSATENRVNERRSLTVASRRDLQALIPRGLLHREGIFNLHFILLFVAAILVILVTSGVGSAERWAEVGVLKATGWQTDQVLLRSVVESVVLGLTAAALSVLLAFVWLRWLNGFWIAGVLLVGVEVWPTFEVPFYLAPRPALLATGLSLILILTGTLQATWRAAVAPPYSVMR